MRFRTRQRVTLMGLCVLALGAASDSRAQSPGPPVVKDRMTCVPTMVPMRDGTRLYTEVYLPAGSETASPIKRPTVIIRSPYGGTGLPEGCFVTAGIQGTFKLGVVTIVQSVRGTGSSEGVFTPIRQERDDGVDVINWAAKQPWSNGRVGMTSGSYLGLVQWQAAIAQPHNLVAITPQVMGANPYDDWILRNGVFDIGLNHTWAQQFVGPNMAKKMRVQGASPEQIAAAVRDFQARSAANKDWIDTLPLTSTWDSQARELVPFLWEQYKHPTYDDFWKQVDALARIDKIKIPVLVGGSWYDYFTKGTLDSYAALVARGGSQSARGRSMLVMDCCGHSPSFKTPIEPGQIDWGLNRLGYTAIRDRFLERYLMEKNNGIESDPKVQLTVLVPPDTGLKGDTFIYRTSAWPVPGTRYIAYHLSSGGHANTLDGDGVLDVTRNSSGPTDFFLYDPKDSAPSLGMGATGAVVDQTPVEKRQDVLVYTAPAETKEKLLIGKISITFWAQTDGKDTDFTAKLVDVHPDGFAHILADRIVRARYRKGSQLPPELLTPNKAYEYKLDLGYMATLLKPGHRLRLEISSSNFPRFERNLNTGTSNEDTAETRIARNTILHDAQYPSFVTIPVVEQGTRSGTSARAR